MIESLNTNATTTGRIKVMCGYETDLNKDMQIDLDDRQMFMSHENTIPERKMFANDTISTEKFSADNWEVEAALGEKKKPGKSKSRKYNSSKYMQRSGLGQYGMATVVKKYQSKQSEDAEKNIEQQIVEKNREDRSTGSKVQMLIEVLNENYDFAVFEQQLYLYVETAGFWELVQESEANRQLRRCVLQLGYYNVNKSTLYEVYECLLIEAQTISETCEHKNCLNFQNVAVNWKDNEIVSNRKNLFFRYALQLDYVTTGKNKGGRFMQFIYESLLNDDATIREFKKFFGLVLSGIRDLKTCFFLYGASNTGKSVVLNVLRALVGERWSASLSFTLMGNEFAITQLLGKRVNLSGEVSGASNKRLDIFKSLTGNDYITACFKGKDHFQFKNESLLVFACNSFPPVQAIDEFDSFLSRIIIFPFDNVVPRSEWESNLDKKLLEGEAEIISVAMEGLKLLEEDDFEFYESKRMKACKQAFIGEYNSFESFAQEYIEVYPEGIEPSAKIKKYYQEFCADNDFVMLADNVWTRFLKQKYCCQKVFYTEPDAISGKRIRAYKGIRLVDMSTEKE